MCRCNTIVAFSLKTILFSMKTYSCRRALNVTSPSQYQLNNWIHGWRTSYQSMLSYFPVQHCKVRRSDFVCLFVIFISLLVYMGGHLKYPVGKSKCNFEGHCHVVSIFSSHQLSRLKRLFKKDNINPENNGQDSFIITTNLYVL